MGRRRGLQAWIAVAVLLGAACGVFLWEPWHGPIILSFSSTHGLDAGDLPALLLVALAVAIGRVNVPDRRSTRPAPGRPWPGPASAAVLGLLLLVALVDTTTITTLLPTGGGTFGGVTQHADGQEPDPVDQWSHLAVTYDGTEVRLFLNGRQVSSRATTGRVRQTSDPLWIGGNEPYGEYFEGEIDDVRVYDRALDPSELRTGMATPPGDPGAVGSPGLVAAYEFNGGSGTRATDASSKNNTGSIIGATWTPEGRFGDALRFDGAGEVVRVPPSASLDLDDAMTLAAWVRPAEAQAGWRTILHRQTDAYFLTASGGGAHERLASFDRLRLAALILATIWLCVVVVAGRGGWIAGERRSWWPPVALFLAGSLVDAALAPAAVLLGPILVAIWLAVTAADRVEAATMCLLTAVFTAMSIAALGDAVERAGADGSVARSAALGVLLVCVGLLGARRARRWGPAGV